MAYYLAKLINIVALVFIILAFCGSQCSDASSLHPRGHEEQSSRWFLDCRVRYRKLGDVRNCENGGLTDIERVGWSQSLKTALSPPPPPVKKVATRSEVISPPPPDI